jgi:hypothetical protein
VMVGALFEFEPTVRCIASSNQIFRLALSAF